MMIRFALLTTLVVFADGPSTAARTPSRQAPAMAGEWRVTWDSDIKTVDGTVVRVNKRSNAQLVLSQKHDSVSGRWIDGLLNEAGSTTPGVPVYGSVHGDTLVLTTGNVRTSRGGIRVSMHGVRAGSALRGTMYVELAGLPPAPRKWEGERATAR